MKKILYLLGGAALFSGCIKTESVVEVKPVEVKVTMDIKVDKALDEALNAPTVNPEEERAKRRARFQERRPKIAAWKAAGIIKETKQGYLKIADFKHTDAAAAAKVAEAENLDRKALYTAVAEKENTTVDFVGQRRALKLAEREEAAKKAAENPAN